MTKFWDWSAFFQFLFSPFLLQGAWTTIWLTAATIAIGLVLGLIAALFMLSNNPVLKIIGKTYVYIWRGTPLLVQLILIYTGLPQLGIRFTVIQSALISLGVNEGAYMAEIIRAGIISVNLGQYEAAKALGMPFGLMMRLIILPQAARLIVPELGNRINGMLKFSTLASVIGTQELLRRATMLIQSQFAVLEIYTIVAIYYLVMTTVWDQVQTQIEKYYSRGFMEQKNQQPDILATQP
jgi:polar amino acid transport system permease protein